MTIARNIHSVQLVTTNMKTEKKMRAEVSSTAAIEARSYSKSDMEMTAAVV
jgi:hypothetical protein